MGFEPPPSSPRLITEPIPRIARAMPRLFWVMAQDIG